HLPGAVPGLPPFRLALSGNDLHRISTRRALPHQVRARRLADMTEGSGTARTLLVVEDDPTINQALADRLLAEGFEVVRAHDGPGALTAYDEHEPDLVLLDLMLPGLDGLEVCRRIQARRPV